MSTANKFFRAAMERDVAYRQSQQRPLFHSGTNRNTKGAQASTNPNAPKKPNLFVAGVSLAGGEDVAG